MPKKRYNRTVSAKERRRLKALRKKYGLGEFKKARLKAAKKHRSTIRGRRRPSARQVTATIADDIGNPGTRPMRHGQL